MRMSRKRLASFSVIYGDRFGVGLDFALSLLSAI